MSLFFRRITIFWCRFQPILDTWTEFSESVRRSLLFKADLPGLLHQLNDDYKINTCLKNIFGQFFIDKLYPSI